MSKAHHLQTSWSLQKERSQTSCQALFEEQLAAALRMAWPAENILGDLSACKAEAWGLLHHKQSLWPAAAYTAPRNS